MHLNGDVVASPYFLGREELHKETPGAKKEKAVEKKRALKRNCSKKRAVGRKRTGHTRT